jgi:hypothetical protein
MDKLKLILEDKTRYHLRLLLQSITLPYSANTIAAIKG